jgi:hypothetical protein
MREYLPATPPAKRPQRDIPVRQLAQKTFPTIQSSQLESVERR